MAALFRSVSQALHFSFLVEEMPVISRVIPGFFRERTTVNLEGMTDQEVRAQCAMIRAYVRGHLVELHAQALEARYSEDRDTKRFAIRALSELYASAIGLEPEAALAIAWRHYLPPERRDRDFTLRQIAESYNIGKSTAGRAADKFARIAAELEGDAMEVLAIGFEDAGIVDALAIAA
jgi:hypothetical protein